MEEEIRKTGIDILGDAPWDTHFCHFYQTKEDLIDVLVPCFKAGLENNEFCMWVTSASEVINVVRNHQFALIKRRGEWELIESSELKRAKEALKRSEMELNDLFAASPDAITVLTGACSSIDELCFTKRISTRGTTFFTYISRFQFRLQIGRMKL